MRAQTGPEAARSPVSARTHRAFGLFASLAAALLLSTAYLRAQEADSEADEKSRPLETKNIFGFTSGTDIGPDQDREMEFETNLAFGKRNGVYNVGSQKATLEVNPTDWLEIDTGFSGAFGRIRGVDGLADRSAVNFGGADTKFSFVLVHRSPATPVGFTVSIEPEWSRISEAARVNWSFSAETRLIFDTELVPTKLYGALNVIYAPEVASDPESFAVERSSRSGISGALAYSFDPALTLGAKQIVLGAELEYQRAYENFGLTRFAGDALFFGPTFYVHFNERLFLAAAISTQIAGRQAGDARPLDLGDFSRNKAQMTIGVDF
ncbi:conserved hypothetical protein [Methylocella silvestris BL2]|uniref:Uncharacterized protein n=1 Tax=Methylocella silvestris (strain DSM 15510 / CIP 108128 / LMG 27833 / NCIMB 13906 / BL2) TaxID=395965 RepID=B8EQV2_METSB|nr:hypothetical protein [Methylocella silvestris]ACK49373.1 conserved hypothetical protein [Methylocella silvestris BL2]